MLGNQRYRTAKLEDGEQVVQLRGFHKSIPYPSNNPHAGVWGPNTAYALLPSGAATRRRAAAAIAFDPALTNRSSDAEVLILGPTHAISRLLASGPPCFRPKLRRPPADPTAVTGFRFLPAAERDSG